MTICTGRISRLTVRLLAALCFLMLVACQSKPAVSPTQSISQRVETYQLDNGLTINLHQDASDPLVEVNVTYHVGSSREQIGRSGFAHFFEHMMFQGSQHVADEQHFALITEAGGTMNGSTTSDITNYYQTVPANELEKVLWLEADRMGFLLPAVTQEKFENQRETVKNERQQRVDNQPYGRRSEVIGQALYPEGHPYSWPVIGYMRDLDAATVDDMKQFFARYYGPNNAVLTVAGDIDVAQTKRMIEKYFGEIPAGPEVTKLPKQPAQLDANRFVTVEDNIHLPLLQITFPTVYLDHPDEFALDVLAEGLGRGKTSILYESLVKTELAVQVFVGHSCRELACEFSIYALANPARIGNLAELRNIIMAELDAVAKNGLGEDVFIRAKSGIEAGQVFGLQSVSARAASYAMGSLYHDDPLHFQTRLARYQSVDAMAVDSVMRRYLVNQPSVVLSMVPTGRPELAAAPQNYKWSQPAAPISEFTPLRPLSSTLVSTIDRTQIPPTKGSVNLPELELWQDQIRAATRSTDLPIYGMEYTETPTTELLISIPGGFLLEDEGEYGAVNMLAAVMNESTNQYTASEFANELEKLGSAISVSSGQRQIFVSMRTLTKHLKPTMELLVERLVSIPRSDEDFNLARSRLLQNIEQNLRQPQVLARRAQASLLFGRQRLGLPAAGRVSDIQQLTLQRIKTMYQRALNPENAHVIAVSDLSQAELTNQLSGLTAWLDGFSSDTMPPSSPTAEAYAEAKVIPAELPASQRIFLVDRPGASQVSLRLVRSAPVRQPLGEQFKLQLLNAPLGGFFNSRLNLNLREDMGATYGVGSRFVGDKYYGYFTVSTEIAADSVAAVVAEITSEFKRYQQQGMSAEELNFLRNAYTQGDALAFETPSDKAIFVNDLIDYELPLDIKRQQSNLIKNVTKDELNALAQKWFDIEQMSFILVGDEAMLREALANHPWVLETIEVPR